MFAILMSVIASLNNQPPLVREINVYRTKNGLPILIFNAQLQLAAQHHAMDMSRNGLNHTGSDGSSFSDRARKSGFSMTDGAEIIAPSDDPKQAVNMWSGSPGHNGHMLTRSYKYFGAASFGGYSCAIFGNTNIVGNTVDVGRPDFREGPPPKLHKD